MERVFSALGKPLRLTIVGRLLRAGPATLKELQDEHLGSKTAVADAVAALVDDGILRREAPRDGRLHLVWPTLTAALLVAGARLSAEAADAAARSEREALAALEEIEQQLNPEEDPGTES
jgi:DNA-binding MarR family transcriptional regulator